MTPDLSRLLPTQPAIIVPVAAATPADVLDQVRAAATSPDVDAIEWRVDYLIDAVSLADLRRLSRQIYAEATPSRVLTTVRSASEGGALEIRPARYLDLYDTLLRCGARSIDVELSQPLAGEVITRAHEMGALVVGSIHDWTGHSIPPSSWPR
ncbi:type I 3-dehydroquinate dehydratase [Nanchangia anserum]|uniref:type I 3-dehydroquinate dehydratase n=1 Tax=Nanchangia anserum TaxID=2692125 RepID=UPI001883ABD0|nr:type I 3-dehydroquinate dehydratase [Nanchangia anserum]QOX82149.1 type I 3-dehydroquinate dehydratase [Nanchangia anserum]